MNTSPYYANEMVPPPRFTARDLLRILFRRKWIILICMATVFSSVVVASKYMKPLYMAEATMRAELWKPAAAPAISRFTDKDVAKHANLINDLMMSRAVLNRVVVNQGLDQEILRQFPELTKKQAIERAISKLRSGRLGVYGSANTSLIRVTAIWEDPVRAANLATSLCNAFIDYLFEDDLEEAQLAYNYVESELSKAEKRLHDVEKRLEQFKIENNMSNIGQAGNTLQADLKRYEDAKRGIEVSLAALDQRVAIIRDKLAEMNNVDTEAGKYSAEAKMVRENIFALETQLDALIERYSERHPSVQRTRQEIQRLKEREQEIIKTYRPALSIGEQEQQQHLFAQLREEAVLRADLERRMSEAEADLRRVTERLAELPEKELELRRLQRQYATAEALHHALKTNLDSAQRTLELTRTEAATVKVLDEALAPSYSFYPNHKKNYLLGILGGLAFALTAAFLLEFLNHSLESSEDVHQHIGLPVLGTVPVLTLK